MLTKDLDFDYPKELIATSPREKSRVMWVQDGMPEETTVSQLLSRFQPEDVLVINTTKVIPARVTCRSGLEVLFLRETEKGQWEVLCPARRWSKDGEVLPCGTPLTLLQTGLPQVVTVSKELTLSYFEEFGDMPLPPYIQEQRGERSSRNADKTDYQAVWAKAYGSLAAPTASLHFTDDHIFRLKARGVNVVELCLHVGLGTFLPVHAENLNEHKMHGEWVSIPHKTIGAITDAQETGGRVWALGTTVARSLESWSLGKLDVASDGFEGVTDLFIQPGFEFQVVDVLMTNFHQPKSTLLALVSAFSDLETVKKCYAWAIERQFRLFSYGDLTIWQR
jgi:S-adenosylmethionine:tRNA ribosyltransferase-isomerase